MLIGAPANFIVYDVTTHFPVVCFRSRYMTVGLTLLLKALAVRLVCHNLANGKPLHANGFESALGLWSLFVVIVIRDPIYTGRDWV